MFSVFLKADGCQLNLPNGISNKTHVKVNRHKDASPPRRDHLLVFTRWRQCTFPILHVIDGFLGPHESSSKRSVYPFLQASPVCPTHNLTDRQATERAPSTAIRRIYAMHATRSKMVRKDHKREMRD